MSFLLLCISALRVLITHIPPLPCRGRWMPLKDEREGHIHGNGKKKTHSDEKNLCNFL